MVIGVKIGQRLLMDQEAIMANPEQGLLWSSMMEELEVKEYNPDLKSSKKSVQSAHLENRNHYDHSSRISVSTGRKKQRDSKGEFHKESMPRSFETNNDNIHKNNYQTVNQKTDYDNQNSIYKKGGDKSQRNHPNNNGRNINRMSGTHKGGYNSGQRNESSGLRVNYNSDSKGNYYNSQKDNRSGAHKGQIRNGGGKYVDKNSVQNSENVDRAGGSSRQQKDCRGKVGKDRQQYHNKYSDDYNNTNSKNQNINMHIEDMGYTNSKSAKDGYSPQQLYQLHETADDGGNGSVTVRERTEKEYDLIQQFQQSMLLHGDYTPEDISAVNDKLLINKSRIESKKKAINMEDISNVNRIYEQSLQIKINERVRDIVGRNRYSGFPGCLPIEINHQNISNLRYYPYKVSWKADGTRYMMLIEGENKIYLIGTNLKSIFHISGLEFRQKNDLTKHLSDTLLDGELIIDINRDTGVKLIRFLVFDAIKVDGRHVASENFHRRYEIIETDIINPRNAAITKGLLGMKQEPFTVQQKLFWDASPQIVRQLLSKTFLDFIGHETDGLMFHCNKGPYVSGVTDTVLKFKPVALTSIDFRLKIVNYKRERYGELHVGSSNEPFGDIEITKELEKLHDEIIECSYTETGWLFLRHRTDRTYPNAYKTALSIWETICNPVDEKYLINYVKGNKKDVKNR